MDANQRSFFCDKIAQSGLPGKPSAIFLRQKLLVLGVFRCLKKIGHLALELSGFQVGGNSNIF